MLCVLPNPSGLMTWQFICLQALESQIALLSAKALQLADLDKGSIKSCSVDSISSHVDAVIEDIIMNVGVVDTSKLNF